MTPVHCLCERRAGTADICIRAEKKNVNFADALALITDYPWQETADKLPEPAPDMNTQIFVEHSPISLYAQDQHGNRAQISIFSCTPDTLFSAHITVAVRRRLWLGQRRKVAQHHFGLLGPKQFSEHLNNLYTLTIGQLFERYHKLSS